MKRKQKPRAKNLSEKRKNTYRDHEEQIKKFLDMIAPAAVKIEQGYVITGNVYRSIWAVREYPTTTEETALLQHLGQMSGVTLRIYARQVSRYEENRLIDNADKTYRLRRSSSEKLKNVVEAESNLQEVTAAILQTKRSKEPFYHVAVYIEICAENVESLRQIQDTVSAELTACKINVDKLLLRQKEGYLCSMPGGYNALGIQFERVFPASSLANLYPFAYSGKTDPNGFYIGHDKFGSSVIVDFERRAADKTNACAMILGNSGMGKSYLLKLLVINALLSGKYVILLDPEAEYRELTKNLQGCYLDLMTGDYKINVLEPRLWAEEEETDPTAPAAFRAKTRLYQHISFLRDFFRSYKDFSDAELDTLEIMLEKLYAKWKITDQTDFSPLRHEDYPILADLHDLMNAELIRCHAESLYTPELLRSVCLGLHSICCGADSKLFNGHTNITSDRMLVFGVKGLLEASRNIKNAMLFNILSYMSGELLTRGNTVAGIDELYLFLSNPTSIEYIRNAMKRVRKKESSLILASQNIEDFLLPETAEMTKPLFSIPTHQFLFHPGSIAKTAYQDALQLEENEYQMIKGCRKGNCLYKCGAERYNLIVEAPEHKAKLFGKAGGR